MPLFQTKIDPFSSFTINLGPLYVERVFDSLLTRQGVNGVGCMNAAERFQRYLDYLKKKTNPNNHTQYTITQFYKGHFYHQLANHSIQKESAQHFREKALCYYQNYLELSARAEESRYYAQWQTGMLQDLLKYPWPLAEDSLVKAGDIDPLRGEAIKKIIDHYIQFKEWKRAYSYSLKAVSKFVDKNPVAHRRWFIDFDAYNWKLLRTHRIICYKLGYLQEKNTVHGTTNNQAISQQSRL
jgi:hypothetical protein